MLSFLSSTDFWFLVGTSLAKTIFLIFLASVFPITVSSMAGVQNMQQVYLRAAQNFGMRGVPLFRRVILPAALPQILTGVRIALGVASLDGSIRVAIGVDSTGPTSSARKSQE